MGVGDELLAAIPPPEFDGIAPPEETADSVTAKLSALKAQVVPFPTANCPAVAVDGTVIFTLLSLTTCTEASWALPIQAWSTLLKWPPRTVTMVPTGPLAGENEVT